MKRTYQKPQVLYEDFSLSNCIAGACKINPNANDKGECAVNLDPNWDSGWYIFNVGVSSVCNIPGKDGTLCSYDVSGQSYPVFSS